MIRSMPDRDDPRELEQAIDASDVDRVRALIGPEIGGARTRFGQLLLFRAAFQDPAVLDALLEVEHPKRDLDEVLVGISTLAPRTTGQIPARQRR